ncbi:MAG: hypothetical protein AB8H79_08615 [Myxococcota bacterium]
MTDLLVLILGALTLVGLAVLIVGVTFRYARAIRTMRPRTSEEWVVDILGPNHTRRDLGGGTTEAEGVNGTLRLRITWSNDWTQIEGVYEGRSSQKEHEGPPDRRTRAAASLVRRSLAPTE